MLRLNLPPTLLAGVLLLSGCAAAPPRVAATAKTAAMPDHARLQQALEDFLSHQGRICLGKFDWPIVVSEREFKRHGRDAVQMPVLEKLGLVTSTSATEQRVHDDGELETVAVKRYELTDAGRRYYVAKEATTEGPGGSDIEHHQDFCGATLTLDQVVAWQKDGDAPDAGQVTLTYTFHVVPADWARDPEALLVFPMLDRVIKGDGTLHLEQRMSLSKAGWVAVAPVS